tara:strand:+ start:835 stop:1239 length:405 start_codon:yes stop_codon:yes gene_type:complete
MKTTLINLLHLGWEKITYAICFGWVASFFIPIKGFLIFTVFVVFADMATGILAAKKEGQKINSRGLYRTIEKIVVYFCAILIFEGARNTFSLPFNITYMAAFLIATVELYSISENIKRITGVNLGVLITRFFNR